MDIICNDEKVNLLLRIFVKCIYLKALKEVNRSPDQLTLQQFLRLPTALK